MSDKSVSELSVLQFIRSRQGETVEEQGDAGLLQAFCPAAIHPEAFVWIVKDALGRSQADWFVPSVESVEWEHEVRISDCTQDVLFRPCRVGDGDVELFSSYSQAVAAWDGFADPCQLLSLFVIRRDVLERLGDLLDGCGDLSQMAYQIFTYLIDRAEPVEAVAIVRPLRSIQEAVAQAKSEAGDDLTGLVEQLDQLKLVYGPSVPLQLARAEAKETLGRLPEAYLAAASAVRLDPHSEVAAIALERLQRIGGSDFSFDDVFAALDSVEGYLVPGQEQWLFDEVRKSPDAGVVLEIGGYLGRSSVTMAFACIGTSRRVFTIDTFFGNDGPMGRSACFYDQWFRSLSRFDLERYVTPVFGYSSQMLSAWGARPRPDFVFIDGGHEYKDVSVDLEKSYGLAQDGARLALHDVNTDWPGPWQVWRQTGRQLLSDHAYMASISSGIKQPDTPYCAFNDEPFRYGEDWADWLDQTNPKLAETASAMRLLSRAYHAGEPLDTEALQKAEELVQAFPPEMAHSVREAIGMDPEIDGVLYYWRGVLAEEVDGPVGRLESFRIAADRCRGPLKSYLETLTK